MAKPRRKGERRPKPLAVDFVFDEAAVPLPVAPRPGPVYFPFEQMEVGRSFTTKRHESTLSTAIKRHRESGHRDQVYKVRKLPDGGCRVWRVK